MFFNYLTIFIALSISAVAIYYSVAGLTAIFAASVIPVIIMGGVLEIGKLVTAVWLHKNWKEAKWWLKTYLAVAVVVLMIITSMGIFGFLSKSHIEQTTASDTEIAKIETLDEDIVRLENKIKRWDQQLIKLNSGETDTRVDNLIDREQSALDKLNKQINAEKQEYRNQAERDLKSIDDKLEKYRDSTNTEIAGYTEGLKTCFSCDDEKQGIAGAKANLKDAEDKADRDRQRIRDTLNNNISSLDTQYKPQIDSINDRIITLKTQSQDKTGDIDTKITQIEKDIETTQQALDVKRDELAVVQTKYRKLEAEVGPVKYIAEFVYGEKADRTLLEEAVRWVIVTIIFVFDPLAVLLLIASQYSFEQAQAKKPRPVPPTDTPPSTPKGHIPLSYAEAIGKSYDGKYHPADKPDKPTQPKTYAELVGKTYEGGNPDPTDAEKPVVKNEPIPEIDDERMDIIGQNGNDGLHYEKEEPKLTIKEIISGYEEKKNENIEETKTEDKVSDKPKETKKTEKSKGSKKTTKPSVKKTLKKPTKENIQKAIDKVTLHKNNLINGPLRSKVSKKDSAVLTALLETTNPDDYIEYEGKRHKRDAFLKMHPELYTDVYSTVDFGMTFPENEANGYLFLRTDFLPTKLFRFNGENWVELEKHLLKESAYSNDYIEHLIERINEDDYNKVLLDAVINESISGETASVFNEIEIKNITEYKID